MSEPSTLSTNGQSAKEQSKAVKERPRYKFESPKIAGFRQRRSKLPGFRMSVQILLQNRLIMSQCLRRKNSINSLGRRIRQLQVDSEQLPRLLITIRVPSCMFLRHRTSEFE